MGPGTNAVVFCTPVSDETDVHKHLPPPLISIDRPISRAVETALGPRGTLLSADAGRDDHRLGSGGGTHARFLLPESSIELWALLSEHV